MNILELTALPEAAGERLDKWITTQVEGVSRSAAQKFCEEGICYVRLEKKAEACEALNKAKELGDPLAERLIKEHCK